MEKFEQGPERIPTKQEILDIIANRGESLEKSTTVREISDDKGLTLLEIKVEGKEPGEIGAYLYTRKGLLPNGAPTSATSIEVCWYQDEMPIGGDRVAIYNEENGEWESS